MPHSVYPSTSVVKKFNPVKVAVVGVGSVGSTTAYTLLFSDMISEVVLIDINRHKAEGESMDLNHAAPSTTGSVVYVGDYSDCADAAIVIITGGANQKPGETRMDLAVTNARILQKIIPEIVRYAPNTILLIATNPVDVLTYVSYKVSGFPLNRVIGSGTLLDSARLRYHLSQHFNTSSKNVDAFIVGEHGDSSLPVWSHARISGISLRDYCEQSQQIYDHKLFHQMYEKTRSAAYDIIERKGYTAYGIAAGILRIVETILKDGGSPLTVSIVGNYFGIEQVALSVPTKLNRNGAYSPVELSFDIKEIELIKKSALQIKSVCSTLDFL
ncbi:LAQU0S06e05908g1_1 [Lachancea quebecensis]|uniref:L-lactate dehydrogenase n=1 Tax=Lachancea quebecensis TaxID=1654605 RepID=A0A0N7MLN5_9SACH|nr:LAQU0S06e05908g1_1 [Lachancea quebecensis]